VPCPEADFGQRPRVRVRVRRANAQQPKLFVGMILILIFAEALALYGLIGALAVQKPTYTNFWSVYRILQLGIAGLKGRAVCASRPRLRVSVFASPFLLAAC